MLELEGLLATDRRACLVHDEITDEKLVDRLTGVFDLRQEPIERALHEDPPHHGCTLEGDARRSGQPVDARSDQRLQRVGNPLAAAARALGEHPYRLLEEQGVAL